MFDVVFDEVYCARLCEQHETIDAVADSDGIKVL